MQLLFYWTPLGSVEDSQFLLDSPDQPCYSHVTDHVTCGFPFVILCLELFVRQGQQREAQPSPLTAATEEPEDPTLDPQ